MQALVQIKKVHLLHLELDDEEASTLMSMLQNGDPDESDVATLLRQTIFNALAEKGVTP